MSEPITKKITDNIIIFPKTKDNVPPSSVEEIKNNLISTKIEIADVLAEELTKEIFRITSDNGYEITNVTDIAFILIALKAIILRYDDIYHPVQDFIDENVSVNDERVPS
jgi:hypothetical protein